MSLEDAANKLTATLKALAGSTSLADPRVRELLVYWISKGRGVKKVMEGVVETALPLWLKKQRQAVVKQYAKELLPADGACSLIVTLGAPKRAFRKMSEYFSTRKVPFEAATGLNFLSPLCTRGEFDAQWDKFLAPLELDTPKFGDTVSAGRMVSRSWSIVKWAKYIQDTPALECEIDWTRPLLFIVRGDGYPTAGHSWTNLTISLANFGERARTPGFLWLVGLAAGAEKEVACLASLWGANVKVRVPCIIYERHMRHMGRFDRRMSHVASYMSHMFFIYVAPKCTLPF